MFTNIASPMYAALFSAVFLPAAGCTSYSIQPRAEAIAFHSRVPKPIPIKVAIVRSTQTFTREAGDQAEQLGRYLEDSGLFEAVYYPLRPTDRPAATIELKTDRQFKVPDGSELKHALNLSTFYLSSIVLKLQVDVSVTGTLILSKGADVIKTYSATGKAVLKGREDQVVTSSAKSKPELDVTRAAACACQAELVKQLVQDRELLAEKLTTASDCGLRNAE